MANFNFVSYNNTVSSSGSSGTLTSAVTSGNLMLFTGYYSTSTLTAISDSFSSSWNIFYNTGSIFHAYCVVGTTGTNTITFTGNASPVAGHAQLGVYAVPSSYVINPYITTLEGPLVGTATTVVNVYTSLNNNSLATATEGIIISIGVDTNSGTVWTQSTGTMRGTQGALISLSMGDYDFTGTAGNIFGTLTATQTTAGTRVYCFFDMTGFTTGGGGGGFLESGWDGGMRG